MLQKKKEGIPVYVLAPDGSPLDPTWRKGRVRHLLKDGKAVIASHKPFVIRLLDEDRVYAHSDYRGGTDPGRTNIGNTVIDEKGKVVYADHMETRNKDIPKLMSDRKTRRQASRRGERLRRKRRAKEHGTISSKLENGRKLASCDEVIPVKDITNTEAKFSNRRRDNGWITPTVRQLVQTHLNKIDMICKILPVKEWTLEINKFAFMLMENDSIRGTDFQNGRMKDYKDTKEYINAMQGGCCAFCNCQIEEYHHIIKRSKGGSNRPENIVGLCKNHHGMAHNDEAFQEKLKDLGEHKKYAALSVLNQAIPRILNGLKQRFGEDNVHEVTGYATSVYREEHNIPKEHWIDSAVIAAIGTDTNISGLSSIRPFEFVQYRRHNRALTHHTSERTYKAPIEGQFTKNGSHKYEVVAKNRRPRTDQVKTNEQGSDKCNSLAEYRQKITAEVGEKEARRLISKLKVIKSTRHKYTDPKDLKFLPGDVVLYNGKRYLIHGNKNKGQYVLLKGEKGYFKATECRLLERGKGIVCV